MVRCEPLQQNQAPTNANCHSLGAASGVELSQDRGDVELYGVLRDLQAIGNLLIAETAGEQVKNFAFARREWFLQCS